MNQEEKIKSKEVKTEGGEILLVCNAEGGGCSHYPTEKCDCECHPTYPTPTQEIGEWEKAFDGRFSCLWFHDGTLPVETYTSCEEEVKSFVKSLLQEARHDEREKLRGEILDIMTKTDWFEEPKSAFGKLNSLQAHLNTEE